MTKYQFIINDIINNIKLGNYSINDRLPKEDELIKIYAVSRITIRTALLHLKNDGIIISKPGIGSFYTGNLSSFKNEKNSVVLILENSAPGQIRLLEGAEYTLAKNGYRISLKISNDSPTNEKDLCQESIKKNASGIIIFPTDEHSNSEFFKKLLYKNYPLVFLDRSIESQPCNIVSTNNFMGIQIITEHLIKNGHTKIAYINCGDLIPLRERLQSFLSTTLQYGLDIPSTYIISCKTEFSPLALTPPDFSERLSYLMNLQDRPTALVCCNDYVALAAMRHLVSLGLKIPEDISITGYDNVFKDTEHVSALTTMEQNFFKIGEIAAQLLIGTINKSQFISKVYIDPTLIIRKTVKNILPATK